MSVSFNFNLHIIDLFVNHRMQVLHLVDKDLALLLISFLEFNKLFHDFRICLFHILVMTIGYVHLLVNFNHAFLQPLNFELDLTF